MFAIALGRITVFLFFTIWWKPFQWLGRTAPWVVRSARKS